MIQVRDGKFKLDDYKLIIDSELSLDQFRSGDIPIIEKWDEKKHSAIYRFAGTIDGMKAVFWITFAAEKLIDLRFWEDIELFDQNVIDQSLLAATKAGHNIYVKELKKWTEIVYAAKVRQKARHEAWLEKVIGSPPPYEYDNWGEMVSLFDPRQEDVEILVRFRHAFGEDVDLRTYFENRWERRRQSARNTPKPLNPGELPPGFRRKK